MVRATRRRGALSAATVLAGATIAAVAVLAPSAGPGDPPAPPRPFGRFEYSPYHHNRHNAIVRVRTTRPLVALTFDDGPDRRVTPAILRTLSAAGERATFFIVGRAAAEHPGLVRAELRAGHQIGDHTWRHVPLPPLSRAAIQREIRRARHAISSAGAPAPTVFRPPRGFFDENVGAIAAAHGERMIGWDVTLDRELRGRSVSAGVEHVVRAVRRGSIVLIHDGSAGGPRSLQALSPLLRGLRRRGLRSVTLTELLAVAGR